MMSKDLTATFEKIRFRSRKPLATKSRERLFANLDCQVPGQVSSIYENCNGGRVAAYGCRLYPLSEAVELCGAFDFHTEIGFLPFFVSENNESDPCMVGLEPPLTGYVFQLCHDLPSRILAPSVPAFFRSLSAQEEDVCFSIEDATFHYPKTLSKAEHKTVDQLIERSMLDLEIEYEPSLLIELALSMMTDHNCISVLKGVSHPDHNARHEITSRLKQIDTPAAKRLLEKQNDDVKAFVTKAMKVLKKKGFVVITKLGTDMSVSAGRPIHLNVPMFFDRRHDEDCWDYLVERVTALAEN